MKYLSNRRVLLGKKWPWRTQEEAVNKRCFRTTASKPASSTGHTGLWRPWPTHYGVRPWPNTDGKPPKSTDAQWGTVLRIWQGWIIYSKLFRIVYLGLDSSSSLLFFLLPDKINHSLFWASHTQSYIPPVRHLLQCILVTDTSVFLVAELLESRNHFLLTFVLWMVAERLV